jgi:hypothetical protein
MMQFIPSVNPSQEFLEIANDFTDPKELIREAISNAFDASSNVIKISVYVDKSTGTDELVIKIEDDGHGMTNDGLESFFGLGRSTRREIDKRGNKIALAIGEKGHGTKIYFNSRRIELNSKHAGKKISAYMDEPRKTLRRGIMPEVFFNIEDSEGANGTSITVFGYNENNQAAFDHDSLKDYIFWFTKFGSFEKEIGIGKFDNIVLHLNGLGRATTEPERISFGHKFAPVNTNITTLKREDKISPLDYYVCKWVFSSEKVIGMPNVLIDMVFYLEGDQAKRQYNPMIHHKYAAWRPGEYNVEQRYGLWLAKDFIPISRKNEWVAEKSEWTKFHAFVNCQDFRLTANRASLDNTPQFLLDAIKNTVDDIFKNRIAITDDFQKYREELQRQQLYKDATAEEQDFFRRKKAALSQRVFKFKDVLLIEPRQEGGVYSLVMQLLILEPKLFEFEVVDYDTSFGYDLLVTKDTALDLHRASLRFVELKYELKREFSHSFDKLSSVICWETRLANDDEVIDLRGSKRKLRITPPSKSDSSSSYTKFMLISDTADHNIEVIVLKEFLKEKFGIDFKARTKD